MTETKTKKTPEEYGWITCRLTAQSREVAEQLRADCGLRSVSSVLDAMVAFLGGEGREQFVDHVQRSGIAVQTHQRRSIQAVPASRSNFFPSPVED